MFEPKEDVYKGYSESNTKPLEGTPQQPTATAVTDAPVQPNPYGQPQPPYAPVQPNPYGQPQMYGQPAYPYMPSQPPKRKIAGKIIAIVIACIVGVNLLLFGGVFAFIALQSPEKKVEAYEQSGNLADLIDACDAYDNQMPDVDDPVAAEQHFETALSDTKTFLRTAKDADCLLYYTDENEAYRTLLSDWLFLMLINGQYDKYSEVFVQKMQESSPSGTYYFDTYTMMHYIDNE